MTLPGIDQELVNALAAEHIGEVAASMARCAEGCKQAARTREANGASKQVVREAELLAEAYVQAEVLLLRRAHELLGHGAVASPLRRPA